MLDQRLDQLDVLIEEEKKRVAEQFFTEAWDRSIEEGIEPYLLAETALHSALLFLSEAAGEEQVKGLVEELAHRHECGHFHHDRVLQ